MCRTSRDALAVAAGVCLSVATIPLTATPARADAEPFAVLTVPWVAADARIPHDGVDGEWHYAQAVARGGSCPAVEYRWDFEGDGAWDTALAPAADRNDLGARHIWSRAPDDRVVVARVEARCGDESASAEFPLRLRVAPTVRQRLSRAVSNGLWYAHTRLVRDALRDTAGWVDLATTAHLLRAMAARGHRDGAGLDRDPYADDVRMLAHTLFARLETVEPPEVDAEAFDLDGDGLVLRPACEENYCGGAVLAALASAGEADVIVPDTLDDRAYPAAGRTRRDVVGDIAEYFAWAQSAEPHGELIAGGWDYAPNSGLINTPQSSWPARGLRLAARHMGTELPDWLAARTRVAAEWADAGRGGDGEASGGYGYRGWENGGAGIARAGAMLSVLAFATGADASDAAVADTVAFIDRNFDAPTLVDAFGGANVGDYYAMVEVAEGLAAFGPAFAHIGRGRDWFVPYAAHLVASQTDDGAWNDDEHWFEHRPEMNHTVALRIAAAVHLDAGPVAVARATPRAAGPGDAIVFDHGAAHALDPDAPLVRFRWNFVDYPRGLDANGDGDFDDPGDHPAEDRDDDGVVGPDEVVWEFDTIDPTERPQWVFDDLIGGGDDANEEIQYRVTLQVEDALGRVAWDAESVVVRVGGGNHPPVALPHPSERADATYTVVPGTTITLDGRASRDPDFDEVPAPGFPAEFLTEFAWDLDRDGIFETAGPQVAFDIAADWPVGQTRVVRLRVCDDGRWSGRTDADCGGDCSMCREADARIVTAASMPPALAVLGLGPDGVLEVPEGSAARLDASGTIDPDGDALTFDLRCGEGLAVAVGEVPGTFDVSARAANAPAAGTVYICALTVGDATGAAAERYVTVRHINAPPTIDSAVATPAREGAVVVLAVDASDPSPDDAAELRYDFDCEGDGIWDAVDQPVPMTECVYDREGVFVWHVRVRDPDGGASVVVAEPLVVDNADPAFGLFACPDAIEDEPLVLALPVEDPGGDPVGCHSAQPLPDGATIDAGRCVIVWRPDWRQAVAGPVEFSIAAEDGDGGRATLSFTCRVEARDDDDDGLPDGWEAAFGIDGGAEGGIDGGAEGDPDADGLSNAEELARGTSPTDPGGPVAPVRTAPADGARITTLRPLFEATAGDARTVSLVFELSSRPDFVLPLDSAQRSPDDAMWAVNEPLADNARWYWRVRGVDATGAQTASDTGWFLTDARNEAPPAPWIMNPADGARVADARPELVIAAVTDRDPDEDVSYRCQLARDPAFAALEAEIRDWTLAAFTAVAVTPHGLEENGVYWLRCQATDDRGRASAWSDPVTFRVDASKERPGPPQLVSPPEGARLVVAPQALTIAHPGDPDGDALTAFFQLSETAEFRDVQVESGPIPVGDDGIATFELPVALPDDAHYHWRAWVSDDSRDSPPVSAWFVLDAAPVPPTTPEITAPEDEVRLDRPTLDLTVEGSVDPDPGAAVRYVCEIAPDGDFEAEIVSVRADAGAGGATELTADELDENARYAARCRAVDETGLASDWTEPIWVTVDAVDEPPSAPVRRMPADGVRVADPHVVFSVDNASDPEGTPLVYWFEIAAAPAFGAGDLVVHTDELEGGPDGRTQSAPTAALDDNRRYWWRAWASDGVNDVPSDIGWFEVDRANEGPSAPVIIWPTDGLRTAERWPEIRLTPAVDPDPQARLIYACEASTDAAFVGGVRRGESLTPEVSLDGPLADNTVQFARCGAIDDRGEAGPWSPMVEFRVDVVNEPPAAPPIIAPQLGWRGTGPDIAVVLGQTRDPEGDALAYEVELAIDDDFDFVVISQRVDALPSDSTPVWFRHLADDHVYHWRARALDGQLAGPWTVAHFILDAGNTAPTAPRVRIGEGPIVSALPITLLVDRSRDPDPLDAVTYVCAITGGQSKPIVEAVAPAGPNGAASIEIHNAALEENGRYEARCYAVDTRGSASARSASVAFRFDADNEPPTAPAVRGPDDGAHVAGDRLIFSVWNGRDPEGMALTYHFEIAEDADFEQVVVESGAIPEDDEFITSWSPDVELEDGTWHWRVVAHDGARRSGSARATFVVDAGSEPPSAPSIASPAHGERVGTAPVQIVVHNASDPDGDSLIYRCEIAWDEAFEAPIVRAEAPEDPSGSTVVVFDQALPDGTPVWLRCRARDSRAQIGPWTAAISFTYDAHNAAPSAPNIIFPPPGSTVFASTMTLIAGGAADPEVTDVVYRFEVTEDPTFGDGMMRSGDVSSDHDDRAQYSVPRILREDTTYYWRVRAFDGELTGPTATSSFTVDSANGAPGIPAGIYPFDGETTHTRPRFTWTPSRDPEDDAVDYVVSVYRGAVLGTAGRDPIWWRATPATFLDAPTEFSNGDYTWFVTARDARGATSEASDELRFTVRVSQPVAPPSPEPDPPANPPTADPGSPPVADPPASESRDSGGCAAASSDAPAPWPLVFGAFAAIVALIGRRRD